eukprot:jgi/Tetstr1/442632/TSEL_030727.t2
MRLGAPAAADAATAAAGTNGASSRTAPCRGGLRLRRWAPPATFLSRAPSRRKGSTWARLGNKQCGWAFATSADHGCLNRVVMYTQLSGTYLLMLNCCRPPRLEGHVRDLGLDASEVLRAMMASTLPALPGSPPELLRQLASEYAAAGVPEGDPFLVAVKEAEASQTEQDGTKGSRAAGM